MYCDHTGLHAQETERLVGHDFVLWDTVPRQLVEVKSRRCAMRQWGATYLIGLSKLRGLQQTADEMFCVPVLLVGWTDAVGFVSVPNGMRVEVRQGGRRDRNDAADVEACAFIDLDAFTLIRHTFGQV